MTSPTDLTVRATLQDELSGPVRAVRDELGRFVKTVEDADGAGQRATKGWNDYGTGMTRVRGISRDVHASIVKNGEGLADLGNAATIAGAAITGGILLAVRTMARFEQQMSAVGSAAGANAEQLALLRDVAISAGASTVFSATEAAEAQEALAKAGFSVSQIIGALPGTLALAAAGTIQLGRAAEIVAVTLKQYRLEATEAGRVSNVLAAGANKSLADVEPLAESLKYAGVQASMMGVSLEETTGVLALFADSGMQGSMAGTLFADILSRTTPRSVEAAEAMRELGLEFYDTQGRFLGLGNVAGELQGKLAGLTDQQRVQALQTIFGQEGLKGALALYQQGAAGVDEYTRAVTGTNAATDAAAAKTDNLLGDIEALTGALESGLITSTSGANSGLRVIVGTVTVMVDRFNALPDAVQGTTVVVIGLTGVVLLAVGAWLRLGPSIAAARTALEGIPVVGSRANAALGSSARGAAKLGAALVVAQIATAAMGSTASGTGGEIDGLSQSLGDLSIDGRLSGRTVSLLGADMEKFGWDVQNAQGGFAGFVIGIGSVLESLTGLGEVFDGSIKHGNDRLRELDAGLAGLAGNGHAGQAAEAFRKLDAVARQNNVTTEELLGKLPQYSAFLDEQERTAGSAALAQQNLADATGGVDEATRSAAEGVKELTDALSEQTPAMTAAIAAAAYQEALAKLNDELDKTATGAGIANGTFDLTAEKGRELQGMFAGMAQRSRDAAAAQIELTGDQLAGIAILKAGRSDFLAAADAAGIGASKARALADAWGLVPAAASTEVRAPGAVQAALEVSTLRSQIRNLEGKVVDAKARGADESSAEVSGLRQQIGLLRGKVVDIFVNTYKREVIQGDSRARGGSGNTMGGVLVDRSANADGGLHIPASALGSLPSSAQIHRGSTLFQWGEAETGGEAFIPLALSKRARSSQILGDVAGMFGLDLVPRIPAGTAGRVPDLGPIVAPAPSRLPSPTAGAVTVQPGGITITMQRGDTEVDVQAAVVAALAEYERDRAER